VPSEATTSYVLVGAMFFTQGAMLWLQVAALVRHRHRSFVLLSIGTTCGISYLLLNVVPLWIPAFANLAGSRFYVASALLLVQMAVSVWGTAELFQSYRQISEISRQSSSFGDA